MSAVPMTLADLLKGIVVADVPDLAVIDITSDSRMAVAGGLFIACPGVGGHGLDYLQPALEAGVSVVLWEPAEGIAAPELSDSVFGLAVAGLGQKVGALADRFFAEPSVAMRVTGITGTNGKTTTAWLVAAALQRLNGSAAYMGTLGWGQPEAGLRESALTTPGVISVHRRLRTMADEGADALVMEVSSHALDQGRVDGVSFDGVAFTNLTRDHLDYHGDMDAYKQAKQALFTDFDVEFAVINVANDYGREIAGLLHKDVRLLTVSADANSPATLMAELLRADRNGLCVRFSGEYGEAELQSPLWGRFNVENLLVAAGILLAQGVSLADAVSALSECAAPAGRMEPIAVAGSPLVVIDFAHTPDALSHALSAVREHCDGALWCVFGAGGDRDQGKRSDMGAVVSQTSDYAVVTDDNPRHEDPAAIVDAIVEGFPAGYEYRVSHDREAAIRAAIADAGSADVVFIAGKGDEPYQIYGNDVREFSDRDVARQVLSEVA